MVINFRNVEDVIFLDPAVRPLLPEMRHFFDRWHLGRRVPALRNAGRRAALDCLAALGPDQIAKLEKHLGEPVVVESLDARSVANRSGGLAGEDLCEYAAFDYFCVWRDSAEMGVTFWR